MNRLTAEVRVLRRLGGGAAQTTDALPENPCDTFGTAEVIQRTHHMVLQASIAACSFAELRGPTQHELMAGKPARCVVGALENGLLEMSESLTFLLWPCQDLTSTH